MKPTSFSKFAADRRTFLKGAGLTGLSLAGAGVLEHAFGAGEQKVSAASYSDADILNFALNLEYLEAEFYAMATWGATLVSLHVIDEDDTTGPTTGGHMVPNFGSYSEATIATALRRDEIAHVKYLRAALGPDAVKKPAIDLDALGYGFANVNDWLKLARQFEDVGVSAYLGAAPILMNATYVAAAAAILGTEAQHSGSVRLSCINAGVKSPAVDSLDRPPSPRVVYDVDAHALSIPRTIDQVLNIVYAGGNHSGGFFPDGMNGTIYAQM
jgi:hypothetical protein